MSCSERRKELKRRRHRKRKVAMVERRVGKASVSEKAHFATKLRSLTPGAGPIITRLALEER